jgi:hypothetical protein
VTGRGVGGLVWAKGAVVAYACPKSSITGASIAWLDLFGAYRLLGGTALEHWQARDVEAIALLKEEWEKVRNEE